MSEWGLAERYLASCERARRLDPKTVRAYRCDLRQYAEWCGGEADPFSRDSVWAYLAFLNERFAPSSVKRKVAALRAFMAWAAREGLVPDNPMAGERFRFREPKKLPKTIPLTDLTKLFRSLYEAPTPAGDGFQVARDRAIIEVLIATGVRVSELSALDEGSVDIDGRILRVLGKGCKERTIQLEDESTIKALRAYIAARREKLSGRKVPALFLNCRNNRMSDRAVRDMIERRTREAGLSTHVTPHMFRHTFATLLLEDDVDIRYIQQLLGHASLSTTEINTHVTSAKLRRILSASNPRRAISW